MGIEKESSSAPRVLQLTQYLGMGGLERVILNLSQGLKDGGRWSPSVFVYDSIPGAPTLNDDFAARGIEVFAVQKGRGFSFKTVFAIARTVLSRGIRVIHSHDLSALIYAVCAKFVTFGAVKVVNTQHSFVHIDNGPLYRLYERFFTFFADQACTVSTALRDQYATVGVNPARVHVVANGMEFPDAPISRREQVLESRRRIVEAMSDRAAATRLAARLDTRWVLCMARIHPGKGQDHVLAVWNQLQTPVTQASTLIYLGQETAQGELARLQGLIERSTTREGVVYAGFTKKPADWRLACDLFISGSEFEGMPLGPIEAIGAGVACVVSDIPGHSMLPTTVPRFKLDDVSGGARAIERALEVSTDFEGWRDSLWTQGASVRENFGITRMTRAYESFYEGTS